MVKNVYQEHVCLNGIKGSKKGESHYKVTDRTSRTEEWMKVIQKCLAKD
jgi:hypothetical protein